MVGWALGLVDLPAHDDQIDPGTLFAAGGFPDAARTRAVLACVALRPAVELGVMADRPIGRSAARPLAVIGGCVNTCCGRLGLISASLPGRHRSARSTSPECGWSTATFDRGPLAGGRRPGVHTHGHECVTERHLAAGSPVSYP